MICLSGTPTPPYSGGVFFSVPDAFLYPSHLPAGRQVERGEFF
jgi:hypothetical protein